VVFDDRDASTPGWERGLTLPDTAFTVEAWVKRGVRGAPPSPPPPLPNPTTAAAQQAGTTPVDLSKLALPPPDALGAGGAAAAQLIVHKAGTSALGDAVFSYYLAATPDYSAVHASVYVPGEGINNRGVYRAAQTAEILAMASVTCPGDPACDPAAAEAGWMHVAAVYNGTVLEIYVDGVLAGRNSWADVEPEPRWVAPLESYGKLTVGAGWAGQLDEVRIHATALSPTAAVENRRCPARFARRLGNPSTTASPESGDTALMASVTFNEGGDGGATPSATEATMRRGGGAPPVHAPVAVFAASTGAPPRAKWIATGRPGARTGAAASPLTSFVEMGPVPIGGHLAADARDTGQVLVHVNDECGHTMGLGATPRLRLLQRAFRFTSFPSVRFPAVNARRELTAGDTQEEANFEVTATGLGCRPGPVRIDYGIRVATVQNPELADFGEPRGYLMDVTMELAAPVADAGAGGAPVLAPAPAVLPHATGAAARGVRVRPAAPSPLRTQIDNLGPSVLGRAAATRLATLPPVGTVLKRLASQRLHPPTAAVLEVNHNDPLP
jgi:hypothetical protein